MDTLPDDAKPDCTYYLTLLRDEKVQVRVGDCFYIIKDSLMEKNQAKIHLNYEELALDTDKLCIFRIDRLWKDQK